MASARAGKVETGSDPPLCYPLAVHLSSYMKKLRGLLPAVTIYMLKTKEIYLERSGWMQFSVAGLVSLTVRRSQCQKKRDRRDGRRMEIEDGEVEVWDEDEREEERR